MMRLLNLNRLGWAIDSWSEPVLQQGAGPDASRRALPGDPAARACRGWQGHTDVSGRQITPTKESE